MDAAQIVKTKTTHARAIARSTKILTAIATVNVVKTVNAERTVTAAVPPKLVNVKIVLFKLKKS